MTKLVVFDVDGTFLDSYGLFERVIREYSLENNMPEPYYEAIRQGYSDPHNHDFKWGVSREEQAKHLVKTFERMDAWSMLGHVDKTPLLFEGVVESMTHLKDLGHTLAIVTSKGEAPLLHMLDHYKLNKHFAAHRTWDDIKRRNEKEKPEPDMLLSVMRDLKFHPDETVMVGDTTMDVKMGRASKAHTIGVAWGMHPVEHLVNAGAHHIADTHFGRVVHTVNKIFK